MHLIRSLPILFCVSSLAVAQDDGYIGYSLTQRGDPESVIYETEGTPAKGGVSTTSPPPDVFLNASVNVGEISIDVQNLTAQINLQAQVLSLLDFNAGVDASINRVNLLIQNVTAKVLLEARLSNLVLMINNVLDSIDLNPIIATLGESVGEIVGDVGGVVSGGGSGSGLSTRSEDYNLLHNILYSVNDYSGNTHTNRVLAQNGDIVEETLDNDGNVQAEKTVGNYKTDMTFTGQNLTRIRDGEQVFELEYNYNPFPGLMIVAGIIFDTNDKLIATQLLAESSAGGSSTISNDEDL